MATLLTLSNSMHRHKQMGFYNTLYKQCLESAGPHMYEQVQKHVQLVLLKKGADTNKYLP